MCEAFVQSTKSGYGVCGVNESVLLIFVCLLHLVNYSP